MQNKECGMGGGPLLRSGTSVGSNYRAACRIRSKRDFVYKMGIAEEEADETLFWMEPLIGSGIVPNAKLFNLLQEANESVGTVVSSIHTAGGGLRQKGF